MEISLALGKNEGYMPGSLGGRSICVGMQAVTAGDDKYRNSTTSIP